MWYVIISYIQSTLIIKGEYFCGYIVYAPVVDFGEFFGFFVVSTATAKAEAAF